MFCLFFLLVASVIVVLYFYVIKKNQMHGIPNDNTGSYLYNGDKWNNYRLGDAYLCYSELFGKEQHFVDKWPRDSIAIKYLKLNKPCKPKNIKVLQSIIKSKYKNNKFLSQYPDPTQTLVLHIRIGDVFCNKLNIHIGHKYAKRGNKKWWDKLVKVAKEHKLHNIIIVAGSHTTKCLQESHQYLVDREQFLRKHGFNVYTRTGNNPDDDIAFASMYAKFYTSTGLGENSLGGYARITSDVVKANNGKILYIDDA